MSESGRSDVGYPKSKVDDADMYLFMYCGGMGALQCRFPIGFTQYVYPIRVPKFTVFNRSLLLNNSLDIGIYDDAGADGFCLHSLGNLKSWWLAFSADGIMTDEEVKAKGKEFNISSYPAYDIFVQSKDLPQPNDPDWQGRIYVHMVWDSPDYLNEGIFAPDMLTVLKHDSDEKI